MFLSVVPKHPKRSDNCKRGAPSLAGSDCPLWGGVGGMKDGLRLLDSSSYHAYSEPQRAAGSETDQQLAGHRAVFTGRFLDGAVPGTSGAKSIRRRIFGCFLKIPGHACCFFIYLVARLEGGGREEDNRKSGRSAMNVWWLCQ